MRDSLSLYLSPVSLSSTTLSFYLLLLSHQSCTTFLACSGSDAASPADTPPGESFSLVNGRAIAIFIFTMEKCIDAGGRSEGSIVARPPTPGAINRRKDRQRQRGRALDPLLCFLLCDEIIKNKEKERKKRTKQSSPFVVKGRGARFCVAPLTSRECLCISRVAKAPGEREK